MAEELNETDNFQVVTTDEAVEPAPESAADEEGKQGQEQESAPADAQNQDDGEGGKSDDDDTKAKGTEAKPDADDAGEKRKPSKRLQKRIDRLTKRSADAERRAEEAERRAEELKRQLEEGKKPEPGKEPEPDEFDSYDQYLDALADWKEARKGGKPEAKKPDDKAKDDGKAKEPEVSQEFIDAREDLEEDFAEMRKAHKDFDELIGAEDLAITPDMVVAMADTDNAGEIAYHLAKNKEEAARIAKLPPLAQAREIGKIEVKLAAAPQQPGKKTTSAPDPIEPIRGSDVSPKDPKDMDFAEYERTMNEKEQGGGGFW